MKKRKLLFHINSLGKGGAEKVVTVLSKYFVEDGYEVVIVTLWRAGEEYPVPEGVRRMNLGDLAENRSGGRLAVALRRFTDLRRIIRGERPDIVLSFCMKANFRSAFGMIGMRTPLLISVRSDPKVHYTPHKASTKWMERKAAGCVFQTEDARAFFDRRLQEKSRIIWNPVDEKYLGKALGRRAESGRIVTVGRISGEKNQRMLLGAFARIKDKFPQTKVQLYGEEIDGGVKKELDEYIRQENMTERVAFMGPCSALERELPGAALFVLPSNYEGMSNALMEAMVMGLPVIATDCPCGGCAMMIEDGASGLLVPVGDERALSKAMERVLSDPQLAESMAENAGRIAERVAPLKIYGEWKAYVEELILRRGA